MFRSSQKNIHIPRYIIQYFFLINIHLQNKREEKIQRIENNYYYYYIDGNYISIIIIIIIAIRVREMANYY